MHARARDARNDASRAICHARGRLRVSRFARRTTEKRETARSLAVMQRRQRNEQKGVMHVQSCRCFVNLSLLLFCSSC